MVVGERKVGGWTMAISACLIDGFCGVLPQFGELEHARLLRARDSQTIEIDFPRGRGCACVHAEPERCARVRHCFVLLHIREAVAPYHFLCL